MQQKETAHSKEQELDLIDMTRRLWLRRKTVLKITGGFLILGILIALFSAKEYTAACEVVPQTSKSTSSSSMARLASMAGINMASLMGQEEQLLSPLVYPNVLNSMAFKRELLQTEINIKGVTEPITLLTYLSDPEYRKFSLMRTIVKYTIGLPGVIIQAIKGEPEQTASEVENDQILMLTKEERKAIPALKHILSIKVEEKKGYVALTAHMPEAYAAAQVAANSLVLLQKYITEFKIDKVQSNLEFIEGRYDVLKEEYEKARIARARHKDTNLHPFKNSMRAEQERLDNIYTLAYGIYTEMATQLEQAKIKVKETTPVLTVINPISMPIKPSKPQRMLILFGFTIFGMIVGCSYVLLSPFFRETFSLLRKEEETEKEN